MRRWALILRALTEAEQGELERAERTLDQLDTERDHPAHIFAVALARARAWVENHRGGARWPSAISATPRGREVAVLAVQGLTSRQIAGQLGNSPRTVETHLSNVYAKLGVDGRLGLVELLD